MEKPTDANSSRKSIKNGNGMFRQQTLKSGEISGQEDNSTQISNLDPSSGNILESNVVDNIVHSKRKNVNLP
jgi:hypothetical protein